ATKKEWNQLASLNSPHSVSSTRLQLFSPASSSVTAALTATQSLAAHTKIPAASSPSFFTVSCSIWMRCAQWCWIQDGCFSFMATAGGTRAYPFLNIDGGAEAEKGSRALNNHPSPAAQGREPFALRRVNFMPELAERTPQMADRTPVATIACRFG